VTQEVRQAVSKQFAQYVFQEADPVGDDPVRPQTYRPRINFDDVPGVIDLIIAQEKHSLKDEPSSLWFQAS
jgi:hypothetical protein